MNNTEIYILIKKWEEMQQYSKEEGMSLPEFLEYMTDLNLNDAIRIATKYNLKKEVR